MKAVSQTYKDNIKQIGREIDTYITYTLNGSTITLGAEKLNQVNRHYDSGILQSCMKQLDIEATEDIPLGTEINCQFGVKVNEENNTYEYINYGNYIIYSSEKQEDSGTYKLVAYDKMLYAMKDYEKIEGKNLCNITSVSPYYYGNGLPTNPSTYIAIDSFNNNNISFHIITANYNIALTNVIQLEPNTQYTISFTRTTTASNNQWFIYDYDNGTYTINFRDNNTNVYEKTFTTNSLGQIAIAFGCGNTTGTTTISNIMLNKGSSNLPYEPYIKVEYPITIRDYIQKICDWLGFTFKNATDTFPNYDKIIENELYLDSDGETLNYTFRDVLTELAQATGSTICINDNDELELRYINDTGTTTEIEGTNLNFTTQGIRPQSEVKLEAQTLSQSATPTPSTPQAVHTITGENTIKVVGKNLCDGIFRQGNVGQTNVANRIFTLNDIKVKGGTTYTISTTLNTTNYKYALLISTIPHPNYTNFYDSGWKQTSSFTFTPSQDGYFGILVAKANGSDNLTPSDIANATWQVERGTATTYEPYIGNSYEVNLGKNLLDNAYVKTNYGGFTNTINSDGSITTTGVPSWNYSIIINEDITNILQVGSYYTISQKEQNSDLYIQLQIYNESTSQTQYISLNSTTLTYTFLVESGKTYRFKVQSTTTASWGSSSKTITNSYQLEKSATKTDFAPYFTPIELCKIGTYQDRLFKASGKNLFDKDTQNYMQHKYFDSSGNLATSDNWGAYYIPIKPNTAYSISGCQVNGGVNFCWFDSSKTFISRIGEKRDRNNMVSPNNASYIGLSLVWNTSNSAYDNFVMLEESTTATSYEPYGNYWYKYNAVGKYTFTGDESWSLNETNTNTCRFVVDNSSQFSNIKKNIIPICNRFIGYANNTAMGSLDSDGIAPRDSENGFTIRLLKTIASTLADFKTWLSTHNTIVYYALATPTYTKLDNTDLINQLEAMQKLKLFYGTNNIVQSNTDLPIKLKFSYTNTLDTIDEEYFKDINVNFGEMSKPINTITFKRAGDSDCISLSYPEDLADEDKNEIAISDNQILAYDNRDEYLQDILDQLYGLSYAINDYSSTGITFYDLCDRYNASITKTDDEGNTLETTTYSCIMLNDEININQGLQEHIYTDMPDESKTDYNTTTKTDRLEKRTSLVVNKQEGYIEAITGELGMDEDGNSVVLKGIRQYQDKNSAIIEAISSTDTTIDENGNVVPTGVKTSTGFTFDKDGLKIQKSDSTYNSLHNERGEYYFDGTTPLGETTPEGSKFKNMDIYGEFRYGKDEIGETALFVGMLFQDTREENGNTITEECFGHFYNGREVE